MIGLTLYFSDRPQYVKPPIGLYPRFLAEEEEVPVATRIQDIADAMERYESAGLPVPPEWIEEYEAIAH